MSNLSDDMLSNPGTTRIAQQQRDSINYAPSSSSSSSSSSYSPPLIELSSTEAASLSMRSNVDGSIHTLATNLSTPATLQCSKSASVHVGSVATESHHSHSIGEHPSGIDSIVADQAATMNHENENQHVSKTLQQTASSSFSSMSEPNVEATGNHATHSSSVADDKSDYDASQQTLNQNGGDSTVDNTIDNDNNHTNNSSSTLDANAESDSVSRRSSTRKKPVRSDRIDHTDINENNVIGKSDSSNSTDAVDDLYDDQYEYDLNDLDKLSFTVKSATGRMLKLSGMTAKVYIEQQREKKKNEELANRRQSKKQEQKQAQPSSSDLWGTSFNCFRCEGTGEIVPCGGGCRRVFHNNGKCAPSPIPKGDMDYICIDCQEHRHHCRQCGEAGHDNVEVFKCQRDECGNYFHLQCLSEYENINAVSFITKKNAGNEKIHAVFICPHHRCDACLEPSSKAKPLSRCIRCPVAYHYNCSKELHENLCVPMGVTPFQGDWMLCGKIDNRTECCNTKYTTDSSEEMIARANELMEPIHVFIQDAPKQHKLQTQYERQHEHEHQHKELMDEKKDDGEAPNAPSMNDNIINLQRYTWNPPGWEINLRIPHQLLVDAAKIEAKASKPRSKLPIPAPYKKLIANDYNGVGKPPPLRQDEIEICSCKYDEETGAHCDSDCELRAMHIECSRWCKSGDKCENQRLLRRQYGNFKLFHTGNKGFGLQANDDIKKGQLIIEYCGEVITQDECTDRLNAKAAAGNHTFYMMRLGSSRFIIDAEPAGSMARFINHSCSANCHTEQWVVGSTERIGIYASRDIPKGEELTYDYLCDTFGIVKDEPCYCGAPNCRSTMGGKKGAVEKEKSNTKKSKRGKGKKRNASSVSISAVFTSSSTSTENSKRRKQSLKAITASKVVDEDITNVNDSGSQNPAKGIQENGYAGHGDGDDTETDTTLSVLHSDIDVDDSDDSLSLPLSVHASLPDSYLGLDRNSDVVYLPGTGAGVEIVEQSPQIVRMLDADRDKNSVDIRNDEIHPYNSNSSALNMAAPLSPVKPLADSSLVRNENELNHMLRHGNDKQTVQLSNRNPSIPSSIPQEDMIGSQNIHTD